MEYIVWRCVVGGHSSGVCVSLAGGSIAVSWFFGDFFIKKKVTGRNHLKTLWRVNLEDKGHAWILFSLPIHLTGTEFWIPNLIFAPALDRILPFMPGVPLRSTPDYQSSTPMGSIIFNQNLRINPWELAIDHWPLTIEHWTLNIEHWTLLIPYCPQKFQRKKTMVWNI